MIDINMSPEEYNKQLDREAEELGIGDLLDSDMAMQPIEETPKEDKKASEGEPSYSKPLTEADKKAQQFGENLFRVVTVGAVIIFTFVFFTQVL